MYNVIIIVMYLSIGISKNNKSSICCKWKCIIFRSPKLQTHYSLIIIFLNTKAPKIFNFPFVQNEKLMVFGVPKRKQF